MEDTKTLLNQNLTIGNLRLNNRIIQGPLAGYSCAPFRERFYRYKPPAYCVSEMISAHDVVHRHDEKSRYLFRGARESVLCYQIAGQDPAVMAAAAQRLEAVGADIIDINCGCPKPKIRKKGAGSALAENPERLLAIIDAIKRWIRCPLTVKIRLQDEQTDSMLARRLEDAGVDALIIHARRWQDNYDVLPDFTEIAPIKHATKLPVIANGDIQNLENATIALQKSGCEGLMVSRAGTGRPWMFEEILTGEPVPVTTQQRIGLFMEHLQALAALESEHQAVLQSKSLVRYYFGNILGAHTLQTLRSLQDLKSVEQVLYAALQP